MIKNAEDMRNVLAEEIDNLRNGDGKSTPSKVNAVSRACSTMLTSAMRQLEYARLQGKKRKITFLE
jgi:hypothetical protein